MKKLALTVLTLLAFNNVYADDINTTITQLQDQINALNAQLNNPSTKAGVPIVGTDAANPLSAMSKVQMPIQVLKAKSQLNNPVVLGGEIETDLQYTDGNTIPLSNGTTYKSGSDVGVNKVYLMTMANINDEATGLVNLVMTRPTHAIDVERAFLIFGNLNKNPFSLMAGANYLPFGNFSGNGPWSNALTTNLFRVSTTNQMVANYTNRWLILNGGIYSNNAAGANNIDYLFNGIANGSWKNINMSLGAGYMNDVRGANSGFGNSYVLQGATSAAKPLSGGTNGAFDINASIGPAYFTLLAEYVSTNHGATEAGKSVASMNAWMLGEQSKFKLYQIPMVYQISYSATDNMSAIQMIYNGNIPQNLKTAIGIQHQWLTSLVGEFWTNVWIGPEFVTAKLYTGQYSYTGTLDATAYF